MTRHAHVIGDPIAHSKSPTIHQFWLKQLGVDAQYGTAQVRPDGLESWLNERRADPAWVGCNITLPHKIAVMALVDDPGDVRKSIGAMNTVFRSADDRLTGTNTDAAGFFAPIADRVVGDIRAAVVGTGGAAHAVIFALKQAGFEDIVVLARSPLKGAALLARFGMKGRVLPLSAPLPPVDLLVNATSLGMVGQPPLDLDLSPLPDNALVYDLVYAPLDTPLLKAADARGLETIGGLDMLVGQAAIAFELFFGVAPPREDDDALFALLTA